MNPDPMDRAEPDDPARLANALTVLASEIAAHGLKASGWRLLADGLNRNDEALAFCALWAWADVLRHPGP